jgi:hypothetical protein
VNGELEGTRHIVYTLSSPPRDWVWGTNSGVEDVEEGEECPTLEGLSIKVTSQHPFAIYLTALSQDLWVDSSSPPHKGK